MLAPIRFGNRMIGPGHRVIVIAEIGINHEGDAEICARLIEEAAKAGADAIKLQTNEASENYVPGTDSHALFSRAQLSQADTAKMFELARTLSIEPFASPGDLPTLEWVDRLEPAAHKISSGLLDHLILIKAASKLGRSVLLSTGMADEAQVTEGIAAARDGGAKGIGVFQCTSIYPAPPETLNLATIGWLEERYGVPAGFSDHSLGTEAAGLGVAAGARMIEKHFTLDPSRPDFDHRMSVDPAGLAELVGRVRAVEKMMGQRAKQMASGERESSDRLRRCLVARRDIAAGAMLTGDDIGVMRVQPGNKGLLPKLYEEVQGRRVRCDLAKHTPIQEVDLI